MMKFFLFFVLPFMFVGCSSKHLSPESISANFWKAQQQNRIDEAKFYTVEKSMDKAKLADLIKIRSVDIGEADERENSATVNTRLYLETNLGHVDTVDFKTGLDKTEDGWRVDMGETKRNLYLAISKQIAGNFGDAFKDGLEGMEGLKEFLENLMQKIKDAVEKK